MAEEPTFDGMRTTGFRGILVKAFKLFPRRLDEILQAEGWHTFTDFMAAVNRMGRVLSKFHRPKMRVIEQKGMPAAIEDARKAANTDAMLRLLAAAFVNKPGEEPDTQAVLEAFAPYGISTWYDLAMAVQEIALALYRRDHGEPYDQAKVPTSLFFRMNISEPDPSSITRIAEAFGLVTPEHFEALLHAFYGGEVTLEDLDRSVGNPEILTEIMSRAPSNPHKGLVFGTPKSTLPPGTEPVLGAKRSPWPGVRPVVTRLMEAVAFDVWPDSPATIADFWITDQAHYEALYGPIRAGEITAEDLDRVLGDAEAITKLVNEAPSNPHPGIAFGRGGSSTLGIARIPYADELVTLEGIPAIRTGKERQEARRKWGNPGWICRGQPGDLPPCDDPDCALAYVDRKGALRAVEAPSQRLAGGATLGRTMPRDKNLLMMVDLDRKGVPGEFVAVIASDWESQSGVIEGWRGPEMESEDFGMTRLEVVDCGNVMLDMVGYWECFPREYTVIS